MSASEKLRWFLSHILFTLIVVLAVRGGAEYFSEYNLKYSKLCSFSVFEYDKLSYETKIALLAELEKDGFIETGKGK
jgi:hypothetical protein